MRPVASSALPLSGNQLKPQHAKNGETYPFVPPTVPLIPFIGKCAIGVTCYTTGRLFFEIRDRRRHLSKNNQERAVRKKDAGPHEALLAPPKASKSEGQYSKINVRSIACGNYSDALAARPSTAAETKPLKTWPHVQLLLNSTPVA